MNKSIGVTEFDFAGVKCSLQIWKRRSENEVGDRQKDWKIDEIHDEEIVECEFWIASEGNFPNVKSHADNRQSEHGMNNKLIFDKQLNDFGLGDKFDFRHIYGQLCLWYLIQTDAYTWNAFRIVYINRRSGALWPKKSDLL